MTARPTVASLRNACRDEQTHSDHVAALALQLFDRTAARLPVSATDRRLLEAACRLHDIGFAFDPARHAGEAAARIRHGGVAGLSTAQSDTVAGAVALHPGRLSAEKRARALADTRNPRRALKLAAFLRVADGLDRSHLQDARIERIDPSGASFTVTVRQDWYPFNARAAGRKADLWEEIFKPTLSFSALPRPPKLPVFAGCYRPRDPLPQVARRLLASQYRVIADNREGAVGGDDPEHLHDIRVAIRRLRSVLRLFRPELAGSDAERLRRSFGALGRQLGPIRDSQVWMAFLTRRDIAEALAEAGGREYLEAQVRIDRRHLSALRVILASGGYGILMRETARFLRVELGESIRKAGEKPVQPLVARKVQRVLRRARGFRGLTSRSPPEDAHDLRRVVRLGRYYAEFGAPAFGRWMHRLSLRFKRVADALGDLHDADVYLARIGRESGNVPQPLVDLLQDSRDRQWKAFRKAWRKLDDKPYRKELQRRLSRAAGRG